MPALSQFLVKISELCRQSQWQSAQSLCDQATSAHGDHPDLLYLSAYISYNLGDQPGAVNYLERSVALDDHSVDRISDLADMLNKVSRTDEALVLLEKALTREPNNRNALNNMGVTWIKRGNLLNAVDFFERAIKVDPDSALSYRNLCYALRHLLKLNEARVAGLTAVRLQPEDAESHNNLAGAYLMQGYVEQAILHYQQAVKFRPGFLPAYSSLILSLHYIPSATNKLIVSKQMEMNRQIETQLNAQADNSTREAPVEDPVEGPVRVGWISGDLRDHPVGRFLLPVLENSDVRRVHNIVYSNTSAEDGFSKILRAQCLDWHMIDKYADAEVCELIKRDAIDLLVDLSGHTGGNRIAVFAAKPAPVQVSYLGYPGHPGLASIDYFIADKYLSGDDIGDGKTCNLEPAFCCYRPPVEAPDVNPLPAHKQGHVTFASLNNATKISSDCLRMWSEIMRQTPGSHLILQGLAFADSGARQRVTEAMGLHGILQNRITLLPAEPMAAHLQRYHEIDIGLDTFPWSGHTTLLNALWMGVPVVSLSSDRRSSRMGLSVLSNLDLEELAVTSDAQYVAVAVSLANNLPRLTILRAELRNRLANSPICDALAFCHHLEENLIRLARHL